MATSTIKGSNLTAGGSIIISTNNQYTSPPIQVEDPFKLLRERSALGALYDSAERPDPPRCHPQTREAVQERIDRWARDRSADAKPILWLTGAAGAGKSAIAQTLIERWKKEGIIVPNFFCWRTSEKRNRKTHIIPTLAFQLTEEPATASAKKMEAVLKHGSIFERSLKSQVEHLIVGPLEDVLANGQLVVIIIDGLDEVRADLPKDGDFPGQRYEDQQRELLEAMGLACQSLPSLRILIASRPERQIRTSFAEPSLANLSLTVSLIDEPSANADIKSYLERKLAEIRQRHPGIDSSWPSDEQISILVGKSSGQFIYPSTVVRYISRGRQFPVKALENVLALQARSNCRKEHPLAELDALYSLVLQSVDAESWDIARLVLGLVCYDFISVGLPREFARDLHFSDQLTPAYLEHFLFLSNGELSTHLTDLHSLLFIPDSHQQVIRSLHTTLSEYLIDKFRSGDFSIQKEDVYTQCAVLLVKHSKLFYRVSSRYTSHYMYKTLLSFVFHSSLSVDLMMALWDFLEAYIGKYSSSDVFPPKSVTRKGADWFFFSEYSLQYGLEEVNFIKYLLSCNNPKFEPSQSHREVIDQRLKEFLVAYSPRDPIAAQYVQYKGRMAAAETTGNESRLVQRGDWHRLLNPFHRCFCLG